MLYTICKVEIEEPPTLDGHDFDDGFLGAFNEVEPGETSYSDEFRMCD